MSECAQHDSEQFPGWTRIHDDILGKICERIGCFIQARTHMPFKVLRRHLHDNIRIPDGDQYVRLLYGPEPIFLSDGEVKLDVKGLVYKPKSRIYKGRLIADF